jgi:hypothetical protein
VHILRFCISGRVMASRALKIASLVAKPRKALFPPFMIPSPRLKHAPRAYYPRNAAPCRQLSKTMVVRQPNTVIV